MVQISDFVGMILNVHVIAYHESNVIEVECLPQEKGNELYSNIYI